MSSDLAAQVRERQSGRLRVLYRVYTLSNADPTRHFSIDSLEGMLSMDTDTLRSALSHLIGLGLLRVSLQSDRLIGLTQSGIQRIQRALMHPEGECHGFPSLVEAGIVPAELLRRKQEELRARRLVVLSVLCHLYEFVAGRRDIWIPIRRIAAAADLQYEDADQAVHRSLGVHFLRREREEDGETEVS